MTPVTSGSWKHRVLTLLPIVTTLAVGAASGAFLESRGWLRRGPILAVRQELALLSGRSAPPVVRRDPPRILPGMFAGGGVDIRPVLRARLGQYPEVEWLYDDVPVAYAMHPSDCPTFEHPVLTSFGDAVAECQRISYRAIEYEPVSLLLRQRSGQGRKLLVYNHGHDGIPSPQEAFATTLLTRWFAEGHDILLSSMPFTGLNVQATALRFQAWDGPGVMSPSHYPAHSLFELVDTGRSHFIRFFMDDAVVPVAFLAERYDEVHYVGFSGGATVGLHTCLALAGLLDSCTLIAGVMPAQFRGLPLSLGDAEQFSSGLLRRVGVTEELRALAASPVVTRLFYNADDPCCFDRQSASAFAAHLHREGIRIGLEIVEGRQHAFDPSQVRRGMLSHRRADLGAPPSR